MIEFDRVSMAFGDKLVLRDFSYRFEDGRHYAVLAPSGGGKTTLLRLAAGLLAPTSGRVLRASDQTAVCFQEDRLLPWHTARQNVALAAPRGAQKSGAALREADKWLARVGLAGEENALPASLSGGMKRRVALARALMCDAPALLLDEPFRALDSDAHEAMLHLIRACAQGKLLLLVTHEESDAQGMEILRL